MHACGGQGRRLMGSQAVWSLAACKGPHLSVSLPVLEGSFVRVARLLLLVLTHWGRGVLHDTLHASCTAVGVHLFRDIGAFKALMPALRGRADAGLAR